MSKRSKGAKLTPPARVGHALPWPPSLEEVKSYLKGVLTFSSLDSLFLLSPFFFYIKKSGFQFYKYAAFYLSLWTLEWVFDVQVELSILLGSLAYLAASSYASLGRSPNANSPLKYVSRVSSLKSFSGTMQKVTISILSIFLAWSRRFLSNPTARITKADSTKLGSYFLLLASLSTLIDLFFYKVVVARLRRLPMSYQELKQEAEVAVYETLSGCGLNFSQSHVVGWTVGFAVFLVFSGNTSFLKGQNMSWYEKASVKRLALMLGATLLLELLSTSTADFIFVNQPSLKPSTAGVLYLALSSLWLFSYLKIFEHLSKKSKAGGVAVFALLASCKSPWLDPDLALIGAFFGSVPLMLSLMVCSLVLVAASALATVILELW